MIQKQEFVDTEMNYHNQNNTMNKQNSVLFQNALEICQDNELSKQLNRPNFPGSGEELPTPNKQQQQLMLQNFSNKQKPFTEESLDDWIAQSTNRPLLSFLDPYKKFKAPIKLISKLKQRYSKELQKENNNNKYKQLLYFQDGDESQKKPNYLTGIKQEKQSQDIIFDHELLQPKIIGNQDLFRGAQRNQSRRGTSLRNSLQDQQQITQYSSVSVKNTQEAKFNSPDNTKIQGNKQIIQDDTIKINERVYQKNQTISEIVADLMDIKQPKYGFSTQQHINFKMNPIKLPTPDKDQKREIYSKQHQQKEGNNLITETQRVTRSKSHVQLSSINKDNIKENQLQNQINSLLLISRDKPKKESDYIFNQNLDMHIDFMTGQNQKKKHEMNELEFSYQQSLRRISVQQYQEAIDQCKQTLKLDYRHFESIFNIGGLYDLTGNYSLACKWFCIAYQLQPKNEDVVFGLALSLFKNQNASQCFIYIEKLVDESLKLEKEEQFPNRKFIFLRALCNKIMQNYKQAQEDYKNFIQLCCPSTYNLIKKLMFTFMFKKKRNLETEFDPLIIQDFLTLSQQIANSIQFINPLTEVIQIKSQIYSRMVEIQFLKRFTLEENAQIFEKSQLVLFNQFDIIFEPKGFVFIITAGNVVIYDHSSGYDTPAIISFYGPGDIIGANDKDNSMIKNNQVWIQVTSSQLEVLKLKQEYFQNFWNMQAKKQKRKEIYDFLKKLQIFQGVSEITIQKLFSEYLTIQKFKIGEIIFSSQTNYGAMSMQNDDAEKNGPIRLRKQEDVKKEKKKIEKNQLIIEKSKSQGFYIIYKGSAEIVSSQILFDYFYLEQGDFIGEHLLFDTVSVAKFGRIKARSEFCYCLFFAKQYFIQLNKLDREIMRKNIIKSPKHLEILQIIKSIEHKNKQKDSNQKNNKQLSN